MDSEDAELIQKLTEEAPYFSAAHLLNSSLKKETKSTTLASLYTNGKLSKRFYNLELSENGVIDEDLDNQDVFNEIEELDTNQFPEQSIEIDALRKNNLHNDIISTLDFDKVEIIEEEEALSVSTIETVVSDLETVVPEQIEEARVSKYDDDQLPYTFLWWLAKTRASHKAIFQPYASPKPANKEDQNPLQQQYVEHIFHLQTGVGIDETLQKEDFENTGGKNNDIIEAFLEKDPQIKPPQHNKLDSENKARKSAEDQNDVVSETLANIYIEQMLYRKAIETYEKLVLKFPEKSRYFADLIKSLEKKL